MAGVFTKRSVPMGIPLINRLTCTVPIKFVGQPLACHSVYGSTERETLDSLFSNKDSCLYQVKILNRSDIVRYQQRLHRKEKCKNLKRRPGRNSNIIGH